MTVTAMPGTEDETTPRRRGRKIIAIVVVLALVAGAAWFLFLKPKPHKAPQPGAVLVLDDQTINLAGGHYLTISLALQLTKDAPSDVDGSQAMGDAIDVFTGQQYGDINTAKVRKSLQDELEARVATDYHGDVMNIYFRKFVTMS